MMRRVPSFAQSIVAGDGTSRASLAVREFARRWEQGSPLAAEEFLAAHAELARRKPFALQVAYEEYCQRTSAGELVDAVAYCQRFPDLGTSLAQLLVVHRYLQDHPEMLESDEPSWPEPNQEFQGFKLVGELGRGTFARVYLARESALGDRQVALKISLDGQSEAETLGRLSHDNIVPVHSVRRDEKTGLSAICMPYRGTVTLEDVLSRLFATGRPPVSGRAIVRACRDPRSVAGTDSAPPDRALGRGSHVDAVVRLGEQLAAALAHAHAEGICHRDLKPSNILMDPAGAPLLLDFNLSSDPRAAERRLGGTLPYMPPEQIRATLLERRREASAPDSRSDIYSLGVILYELLCCASPFGDLALASPQGSLAEAATELIRRQAAGPRPIRSVNPHVNARLAAVVESCLAVDPARRPASAAQLAVELKRANAPAVRARRWVGMHRGLAAAAASILLFGALAVGGWMATRDPYVERQLQAGKLATQAGETEQAIEILTDVVKVAPVDWRGFLERGRAYAADGNWQAAALDFMQAARLAPKHSQVLVAAGYANGQLRQSSEARDFYQRAYDLGYREKKFLNNYGSVLMLKGDYVRAQQVLSESLDIDPDLGMAHWNRAVAALQQAVSDEKDIAHSAVTDISKACGKLPESAQLHFTAAAICARSSLPGTVEKAFDELRRAAELGIDPARFLTGSELGPLRVKDPQYDTRIQQIRGAYRADAPAELRQLPRGTLDLLAAMP